MKKVLFLFSLLLLLFLFGCGQKVHENIREEMAEDTNQIIKIMDQVNSEERVPTEQELEILNQYYIQYGSMYDNPELAVKPLTEEESRLFLATKLILEHPDRFYGLESNKEDYENTKRRIQNVIKTGQIYDE